MCVTVLASSLATVDIKKKPSQTNARISRVSAMNSVCLACGETVHAHGEIFGIGMESTKLLHTARVII